MAKKKPPAKMLAVLGRSRRTGRWRPAKTTNVLALFGGCKVDMTHAVIDEEELKMTVTVLFGTATVMVPEGAVVQPSGISLLAASNVLVSDDEPDGPVPTITIEWTTVLGRLRIFHPSMAPDLVEELPPAAVAAVAAAPAQIPAAAPPAVLAAAAPAPAPAVVAPAPQPAPVAAAPEPAPAPAPAWVEPDFAAKDEPKAEAPATAWVEPDFAAKDEPKAEAPATAWVEPDFAAKDEPKAEAPAWVEPDFSGSDDAGSDDAGSDDGDSADDSPTGWIDV
ncbi:MAG: hypothetical protein AAF467_25665 [Actinomycetota bacterium]